MVEGGANDKWGEGEMGLEEAHETFKHIALLVHHLVHKFGIAQL